MEKKEVPQKAGQTVIVLVWKEETGCSKAELEMTDWKEKIGSGMQMDTTDR